MVEVQEGGLRGDRVRAWREGSGICVEDCKAGEFFAEAALVGGAV